MPFGPRTTSEAILASIWAELLRLERVGVHDNFFMLGGHSLLAIQILSRVGNAFQVELPVRSLFEAPTVADLAEYIEMVHWAAQNLRSSPSATVDDREEETL
jgi:surfactin family lipopeptide synthetase A